MKRSIFSLAISSCIFQGLTQVAIAQTHHALPPIPNHRQTQSEPPKPSPSMVIVSIFSTGDVYLEQEQVSSEQLAAALQKIIAQNPNVQIILSGSSQLMYGQVMQVLGEIQKVGGNRISLTELKSDQLPILITPVSLPPLPRSIRITPVPLPSLPRPIFPKLTPPPSTVIPPLPSIPPPQPLPSLIR